MEQQLTQETSPILLTETEIKKIKWKGQQLLKNLSEDPFNYAGWMELNGLVQAGYEVSTKVRELIKSGLYTCQWEFYNYNPPDPRRVGLDLPCKAEVFHKAVEQYFVRLLLGGNRSSKSVTICAEVAMACLGSRRYTDYWKKRVPIVARIVAPDFTNSISKSIIPIFEMLLPHKSAKQIKNQLGQVTQLNFANGSILQLMSYDQKVLKHASVKLDLVAFDEPPPKNIYEENAARTIDKNGKIIMGLTPIKQDGGYPIGWIFDDIYEEFQNGNKKYFCMEIDIEDNRESKGGYLPDVAVDRQIEEWSKDEETYLARKSGKFTHMLGLVFKDVDQTIHKIEPFDVSDPSKFTRYCAIDPHPRSPISYLALAVARDGTMFFYDEIAEQGLTIKEFSSLALNEHENKLGKIDIRFIDESSDADNQLNRTNVFREFKLNGISCRKASNKDMYNTGIDKMKELLRPSKSNYSEKPLPKAYVFSRCQEFWYQLTHYVWQERISARARENANSPEKPRKKDDHLVNCALYIVSNNPIFIDYNKEQASTHREVFFKKTGY